MQFDVSLGGGGVSDGVGLSTSLFTSTESSDASDMLDVLMRLPA